MAMKDAVERISKEFSFKEEFKNKTYFQTAKLWEKNGKSRIYVPADAYEQAGYITQDANDVKGRRSGEYRGWYYDATRPGVVSTLMEAIDLIAETPRPGRAGDEARHRENGERNEDRDTEKQKR